MIISHFEAKKLIDAHRKNQGSAEASLDLNKSTVKIKIENDVLIFPDSQRVEISKLKKIIKDDSSCFFVRDNSFAKVQFFSEETNKFYKLVPTRDAPTIEISGIRMHVTKAMTPMQDTKKKIEAISPLKGIGIDTCMGLGYTAIEASHSADFVFTCEKDEYVIEIARLNPWSQELFNNKKINVIKGSSFEQIRFFKPNMFDFVVHDPPRLSLATELYSQEFYNQIHRVLKQDGKLYHYIGNPGSKNRNVNLPANVAKRLHLAGFKNIEKAHYGLCAKK